MGDFVGFLRPWPVLTNGGGDREWRRIGYFFSTPGLSPPSRNLNTKTFTISKEMALGCHPSTGPQSPYEDPTIDSRDPRVFEFTGLISSNLGANILSPTFKTGKKRGTQTNTYL